MADVGSGSSGGQKNQMGRKVRFACFGHAEVELRRLRALWLSLQFGFELAGNQTSAQVGTGSLSENAAEG